MNPITRRRALALATVLPLPARAAEPEKLVWLGFELVDDHPDPARTPVMTQRLAAIGEQLSRGLNEAGLYRVVAPGEAQELLDALRQRHEFIYRCSGCREEVGTKAGVRLVGLGWVQRVSELILNINVEVSDIRAERVVLAKSVDLRGNTDQTWERGMRFMLRDWGERRARDPRYGL